MNPPPQKAHQLRDAVRRLVVANGTLHESRRPCGQPLSVPHAYALLELLESTEPLTTSGLARRLLIDRTNVSRLCARMEEAGEIVRKTPPEDRRARVLVLTPRGRKLARSVDQSSAKRFDRLLKQLGGSTATVIKALEALEAAILAEEPNFK